MSEQWLQNQVLDLLATEATALFQRYGCHACEEGASPSALPAGDAVAVIEAGGVELEVSLVLAAPFPLLAMSYPSQSSIIDVSDETLEDWLGEICNQLMGKVKNRLIHQDVRINIGLPDVFFDAGVNNASKLVDGLPSFRLKVDGLFFDCYLSLICKMDGLILCDEPAADNSGELELF